MSETLFADIDASRGRHESSAGGYEQWLTPPFILNALGPFDLDPCAAQPPRPWATAATHWTEPDNSLLRPWHGRVWLNPPYGPKAKIGPWMARMADHNNGIALIFARTETQIFFSSVWDTATGIMFLKGRLNFYRPNGTLSDKAGGGYATAPSCLVAYGATNFEAMSRSGLNGKLLAITPSVPSPERSA